MVNNILFKKHIEQIGTQQMPHCNFNKTQIGSVQTDSPSRLNDLILVAPKNSKPQFPSNVGQIVLGSIIGMTIERNEIKDYTFGGVTTHKELGEIGILITEKKSQLIEISPIRKSELDNLGPTHSIMTMDNDTTADIFNNLPGAYLSALGIEKQTITSFRRGNSIYELEEKI
jgi:hypothetical protein